MKFNEAKLRQIIEEETQAELKELREQQILNEDIFGTILNALTGILPGGVISNIKEWIAQRILGFMGVDIDGWIGKVMINIFGNLTMDKLAKIMSGHCETITSELAAGATETLAEEMVRALGIDTSGWFAGAVRESMGDAFLSGINEAIGKAVCDLDFSSLFTGGQSDEEAPAISEVQERIQEKLTQISMLHEEEKKNWMKDIKSTGECSPYTKPGCKGRAKAFAKRAQKGDVHDDNLKKGKNPHGPG